MNIQNLLKNWKTTSAGVASILSGIPMIIAALKSKSTDPAAYTPGITAIVVGGGLLFAGDADKSATKADHDQLVQQVQATQAAVVSGDTSIITKASLPAPDAQNQPKV